jgi:hypothetical protein
MPNDIDDVVEEILVGGPAAEDHAAWKRLVAEPGGATAWETAVARQKWQASVASLVSGRPWLAQAMLLVRRAARRLARPLFAPGSAAIRDHMLDATLGPGQPSSDALTVSVDWGGSESMAVPLGATVAVTTDGPSAVWWMTSQGRGPLPTKAWKLELGEAPVVLAIVQSEETGGDLDELLTRHVAALVVLTERPPTLAEGDDEAIRER